MKRKMASFIAVLVLFSATTYTLSANLTPQNDFSIFPGSTVVEKTDATLQMRPSRSTSADWAGYAVVTDISAPARGVVTDVVGQWTVPSISSSRDSSYSAVWVGIDGYTSSTIQQIGTAQDNPQGPSQYYAWYEVAPDPPVRIDLIVKPGDAMRAEVSYIGDNKFTFSLDNLTTGDRFNTTQTIIAERLSAEWVVEAPSSSTSMRVLPLANFGTVKFTGARVTINGHTGSIIDDNWQFDPIRLINRTGFAYPSVPTNGGTSFTVSWGGGSSTSFGHGGSTTTTDTSESTGSDQPTAPAQSPTQVVRPGASTIEPQPIYTAVPTMTVR